MYRLCVLSYAAQRYFSMKNKLQPTIKAKAVKGSLPTLFLTDKAILQIIGALWLLDALLQVQPAMFTMNMINGTLLPIIQNQPAPIAANLSWIVVVSSTHIFALNWGITIVQACIGVALLTGRWIRETVVLSAVWGVALWYAGEGLSGLLTGQSSALVGAPGSILLYVIIAVAIVFRHKEQIHYATVDEQPVSLQQRVFLRRALGGFWIFAGLLQLQPYWWQYGQISNSVNTLYNPGTLQGALLDPILHGVAAITQPTEGLVNALLVLLFLALGVWILLAKPQSLHSALLVSLICAIGIWGFFEAFGMIFSGMSTDPNTGPLIILMTLALWEAPKPFSLRAINIAPQQQ